MQKPKEENNKLLVGLVIIFYVRYYHFRNIEKKLPKKTKIAKTKGKNPRPTTSQRNPTVTRH